MNRGATLFILPMKNHAQNHFAPYPTSIRRPLITYGHDAKAYAPLFLERRVRSGARKPIQHSLDTDSHQPSALLSLVKCLLFFLIAVQSSFDRLFYRVNSKKASATWGKNLEFV